MFNWVMINRIYVCLCILTNVVYCDVQEDEEESMGDVDLWSLVDEGKALTVNEKWLQHLQASLWQYYLRAEINCLALRVITLILFFSNSVSPLSCPPPSPTGAPAR